MSRSGARLAGAIVLGVLLVTGVAVAGVAWLWSRDGIVRIDVDEGLGGDRVSVSVPAWLLRAGMLVDGDLRLDQDAEPWLPALRAALDSWDQRPDGVVVQSRGPDGAISILKDGDRVVLRVSDGAERVRIELPARALARVLPAEGR